MLSRLRENGDKLYRISLHAKRKHLPRPPRAFLTVFHFSPTGSPTEQKFRAELKKLHAQYPDRMSQLLSACRQGFPSELPDSKKSRRSLFLPQNLTDDGPEAKRSKDEDPSITSKAVTDKQFVHSSTSPFKFVGGSGSEASSSTEGASAKNPSGSAQVSPKQGSPEQKVLLERQKQQKLLEEQRDFQLQDERWKRIERELDKAFAGCQPKVSCTNTFPQMVHQASSPLPLDSLIQHSSVGIQASLIDDLSPLKPPSYYRSVVKSPWQPIQASEASMTTPSPVPSQNGIVVSPPVRLSVALGLQVPSSSGNASSMWTTPPSGQSTPSPNPLVKLPGRTFNTPALYSPRSLTPTPTPTGDVLQSAEQLVKGNLTANVVSSGCSSPVTQSATCAAKTVRANETPSSTTQLLSDVSKRLSLPQN